MSASSPSQTLYSIGYDFHSGTGTAGTGSDNGNVFGITNYKDTTRNQSFTYDALNRLTLAQNAGTDCTAKVLQNKTEYWGNSYGYDAWENLLNKSVTKCSAENFSVAALANNQLSGYGYDAAGNMTNDPTDGITLNYDPENRLTGASGYTYTYDGDGNRVKKSNGTTGTIYWYMAPGIVGESDLSGNLTSEYVFFDGGRVARKDFPSNVVSYYFSDHLKTASVVTDSLGNIRSESDYYPWGGELQFTSNDSNHFKFTGKERDAETNLDYFGARYYSNGLGRFVTPDWAAKATTVPYADFGNPQSLNLYGFVGGNPASKADPDGHCIWDGCVIEVAAVAGAVTWLSAKAGQWYYDHKKMKEDAKAQAEDGKLLNKIAENDSGAQNVNVQWVAQDYQNLGGQVPLDGLQDATDGVDFMNTARGMSGSSEEGQTASDKGASTTQDVVNDAVARTQETVHDQQQPRQQEKDQQKQQQQGDKSRQQQQQKSDSAPTPEMKEKQK